MASGYTEASIKTLSSTEHIRLRPGMYIGRLGNGAHAEDGIYVLLKETIDNSVDEFTMGSGKKIEIEMEDRKVRVRDYGRGIPLGKLLECVSVINTGAKYDSETFKKAVGLNGVGQKAVNALSVEYRAQAFRDGETKQVEFMSGNSVLAPVIYVYDGGSYRGSRRPSYGNQGNTKVWVMREFKNSEENHLGMPLPAGRLRLYRRDASDGRLEFVGEDEIDHTPKNETVRFYTGDSFDLVGERTMTNSTNGKLLSSARNDRRQQDQSFEIKVRNRKSVPVEIRVVEHLMTGVGINWEITEKSMDYVKTNASTIEFHVTVEPDQEQVVTYTVHYAWP